jgi:hypothetical protein
VSTWLSIGGWLCVVVAIVGLALSVIVLSKGRISRGLRGIAWSLIPLAAYLTHAVRLIGRIGSAVVQFAGSFVFSTRAWLGVILLGISVLLFLVSGGIPLLRWRRKRNSRGRGRSAGAGGQPSSVPAARSQPVTPPAEDDLGDVQEILRRRGIK